MHTGDNIQISKKRTLLVLCVVTILMFGFAFALVPLYDTLCRALGINGKIEQVEYDIAEIEAMSPVARDVRVELVTSNSEKLDWSFYPLEGSLTLAPGETRKVQFHAKNNSARTMTVQAIPSVTPGAVTGHLVKTECFCFQKQTLAAGESVKMPLVFYIDPDLPEKYQTLTLSYALFDAGSQ